MCDSPVKAYLAKNPKVWFGNFFLSTKQYREYVQIGKEYIFFGESKYLNRFSTVQEVYVPCGKCIQCLHQRSKSWEIRSAFQMKKYPEAICCTLTYDDEHLPKGSDFVYTDNGIIKIPDEKKGVINYKDVQDFIKRIRKRFRFLRRITYFCSCEYGGSNTLRPHYHIIIYNYKPKDLVLSRQSKKGTLLYKSKELDRLWGKGFVDVGKVTVQTCRYISQYCCKKLLKERKSNSSFDKFLLDYKIRISRECLHASQGLGLDEFKKQFRSIVEQEKIIFGKYTYAIPRYFIKKLEEFSKDVYDKLKFKRHKFWLQFKWTQQDQFNAKVKSEKLLSKLNLFHSDMPLLQFS